MTEHEKQLRKELGDEVYEALHRAVSLASGIKVVDDDDEDPAE